MPQQPTPPRPHGIHTATICVLWVVGYYGPHKKHNPHKDRNGIGGGIRRSGQSSIGPRRQPRETICCAWIRASCSAQSAELG